MMKDNRCGLPPVLLNKCQTPFDQATTKLKEFLSLGSFPNHLTEEECARMHAIYKEAIKDTEELERIVMETLTTLRRKRARSPPIGWESPASQRLQSSSSKLPTKKHRPQASIGEASSKRRKGVASGSSKDHKNSPLKWPAWTSRTPEPGDQVAAKDDNENLWFLARVEEHLASQDVFVVADEDNSEDKHRRCKVRRSNILTLPQRDEVSGAIFPKGSKVMTLYPNTTTFYPATISGLFIEGRNGASDRCVLQFQDDELTAEGRLPHHTLPACYVRHRA